MLRNPVLLAVGGILGVVLLAIGVWAITRGGNDSTWVVDARMRSSQDAEDDCGDLPGIKERGWRSLSDQPPGAIAEGVDWTVEGRGHAGDVADCLREIGAIEVEVRVRAPSEQLKSFENTGP